MFEVRRAQERGVANHGWLDSRHTFSFAQYQDPRFMGFGVLRVINEDRVEPGQGFATHPHRDMEIFTYVLEGQLAHKDSMGNGSTIRPGDVQVMSAGTGILHSEYNPSGTEPVHFLQIWMLPERPGLPPRYAQRHFPVEQKAGRLCRIGSRDGVEESVVICQDVNLYCALLARGVRVEHRLAPRRRAWLQVARGRVEAGRGELAAGDGMAVVDEQALGIVGQDDGSEILLFDLP